MVGLRNLRIDLCCMSLGSGDSLSFNSDLIEREGAGSEPRHHEARHEAPPFREPRHRNREGRQDGEVLADRREHSEREDDGPQAAGAASTFSTTLRIGREIRQKTFERICRIWRAGPAHFP